MKRTRPSTSFAFAAVNALFIAAVAAVAAWSLFPVYGSARYVTLVAAAIGFSAIAAVVAQRLGLSGFALAGIAAIGFVVLGLTLAIPGFTSAVTPLDAAMRDIARGPVTGWKDVVTLPLPLGEYGATLVPALALMIVGTAGGTWLAVRARRWWGAAALVGVGMVVAAIVVGPATRADALTLEPYGVYVNREFIVGLAAFAVLLCWLGWRAVYTRRLALASASGGARLAPAPRVRTVGTAVTAAVMIVGAVAVAGVVAGPVAAQTPRDVARTAIDPRVVVDSALAPLAAYRTYFSDAAYDSPVFTVKVTTGDVERVRVATLAYFTGDEFTASAPAGVAPARFERLPSRIAAPDGARPVTATITVNGLSGIWLPLAGSLGSVTFTGARAGELTDSFFYQPYTASGLITGGVRDGDTYTVEAYEPGRLPKLADIGAAPGGAVIASDLIPPSLSDWVMRQGVTHDGAGLEQLVSRLRQRGYLSHALAQPPVQAKWETALDGYTFASSAAGHSYDRIDRMFTALTAREAQVGLNGDQNEVAAVGDDEQFAAAVALMAADLGFSSRVVLGVRLTQTDSEGWTVPPCADGVCEGKNMAVWTEVESASGQWVPIDVTPQHSISPSPDVQQQQDPKFASALDPQRAAPIAPPSSQRGSSSAADPPEAGQAGVWAWLGPIVTAAGISLLGVLILVGPLIAIAVWKGLRRRRRRRGAPREAIHHGWDEYVDTAVDAGLAPLPLATRLEAARAYGSANGERLARLTDAVTFGTDAAGDDDAEEFWQLVAADRKAWLASRGFWRRLRMRLSVRSMLNAVALQAPAATPQSTTRVDSASGKAGG